ncbi:uncharacterized protein A4U43_C01F35070 [Asparagus officinalis]|uniref:DUF4283 domain-containing protein n=1 Tax=Asparagus officinalis TaxID=4686 RepID=A0A5P1FX26_ASPOF|nr:uncharacterized protein A4U43_C01F35070 [Asparagus officinalis]
MSLPTPKKQTASALMSRTTPKKQTASALMSRTDPIQIPESVLLKGEDLSLYLVFKIIAEEATSLSELQRELPVLWKCACVISGYCGDDDVFFAKFEAKSEVDRVVEGAPWVLRDNLVSVQRCRPCRPPRAYPFFTSPFYARMHNLPKHTSPSPELLASLNRVFGNTVSSLEEIHDGSDRCVRVRVDIDVSKPLVWSLPFCGVMLPVSYENLPKYCIFCGLIGHEARNGRCRYFKVTEPQCKRSLRHLKGEGEFHSRWKQGRSKA